VKGMEEAFQKMLKHKKEKDTKVVISKKGKVVEIPHEKIPMEKKNGEKKDNTQKKKITKKKTTTKKTKSVLKK
jgi:hypothetical protein